MECGTLQKRYHYDPRSSFQYYNLTSPPSRGLSIYEQLCGFEPWEPSPVPRATVQISAMSHIICRTFHYLG